MACVLQALSFATYLLAGAPDEHAVDLELVLANDASASMDVEERQAQLQGYASAFRDPAVIARILDGIRGRIAVTYMQWSGDRDQAVRIPWRLIDGFQTSSRFAETIERLPVELEFGPTSLGSALSFGAALFDQNSYEGQRRVIDIAGDGVSNDGPAVELVRNRIVARGITINGLAMIFINSPTDSRFGSRRFLLNSQKDIYLERYYRDHVIGGAGSFVSTIRDKSGFVQTLKMKLIREIAGRVSPCVDAD
ncbi:hypothetical protein GCM10007874_41110 [Labrys miyagiensis]|uniref:VWFA domain-containing protein n=1 Tax=Labrys miyagiensis TaxID=346912 RepID=A0ABQ6CMY0_9HYPH|nr:DUF1194 domain-containing protein [Labrys miyagiensis]GLS21094.1 hypothetical protein GCM10007874_41110 [Labrys miyagiensis]